MDKIIELECWGCGEKFAVGSASECLKCGGTLKPLYENQGLKTNHKNKKVAGILAILLGMLGAHRFYLGRLDGIFYILLSATVIFTPAVFILSVYEGIKYLVIGEEKWNKIVNPKQKKAGSLLIIGNIFAGGLGILLLLFCLYAYLSHLSWSKYLFETDAKNYVVSAFQKTSKAREFYEENNHFSSSEAIESEKIIFNGMEYEVSFRIENNMIDMVFGAGAFGEESYNITLVPKNEVSGIFWNCEGGVCRGSIGLQVV